MASVRSELRELVDDIRSLGFQCAIERDGHWHIYRHGRPVLKPHGGGPVTLPGSPSSPRWRDDAITMLVNSRVLARDPRREGQIALAKRDPELRQMRDEMKSRLEAAPKERPTPQPVTDPRTVRVRQATVDAINQLGVTRSEFVRLMMKVGEAQGLRTPKTANAGEVAVGDMINHDTYRPAAWLLDVLEATLNDIGVEVAPTHKEDTVVESTVPDGQEETVAEKKKRAAPAPDPRMDDLRRRMQALVPKHMNAADFVRIVMAAGRKQRGMRLFANEQAGQVGVRRIINGGGGQKWVVDLLEVGVPAAEEKVRGPQQTIDAPKPTEAEVLAGMRDLGKPLEDAYTENAAVEAPEVVPTHWTAEERKHLVSDAEFAPAANGSNGHRVTADDLRELVIIARAHALLRADDGTIPETDDLGKLIEKKIEQLAAL